MSVCLKIPIQNPLLYSDFLLHRRISSVLLWCRLCILQCIWVFHWGEKLRHDHSFYHGGKKFLIVAILVGDSFSRLRFFFLPDQRNLRFLPDHFHRIHGKPHHFEFHFVLELPDLLYLFLRKKLKCFWNWGKSLISTLWWPCLILVLKKWIYPKMQTG